MRLFELNTSHYPFKLVSGSNERDMNYHFDSENNRYNVNIYIDHKYGPSLDIAFFSKHKDKEGTIDLKNIWSIKKTENNNQDVFKIFSTVIEILKHVLKRFPKIKIITFSSKPMEETRVKLYKRFVSNVSKYLPSWKLKEITGGVGTEEFIFKLEKNEIKEIVNEHNLKYEGSRLFLDKEEIGHAFLDVETNSNFEKVLSNFEYDKKVKNILTNKFNLPLKFNYVFVDELFLSPKFRGKNIGIDALHTVLKSIKNPKLVILNVGEITKNIKFESLKHFYKKFGFILFTVEDYTYGALWVDKMNIKEIFEADTLKKIKW